MLRTWLWRDQATRRRIRRWRFYYENVVWLSQRDLAEIDQGAFWTQTAPNRFAKFSASCDHHGICRLARYERKRRNHRMRLKTAAERLGLPGVKWPR